MTLLRFLLLSQGIFALFIAGGLFFKESNLKNRSISLFVLLFGIEICEFLFSTSQVVLIYPDLNGLLYFEVGFLYGPLFYIHVLSLKRGNEISKWHWLHVIPAVVVAISLMDIFMMDGMDRIAYAREHFFSRIMPYNYARAAHMSFYAFLAGYFIYKHRSEWSGMDRVYVWAITTIYILASIAVTYYTGFATGWRQFIYYYLIINSLIMLIGYLLYFKPEFLKAFSKKYFHSSLCSKEMEQIFGKIKGRIEEDQLFLQRDLKLSSVASKVEEPAHKISQTLSAHVGKNFNEFINGYRINYAEGILRDPSFDHYKIEAVALDAGFSNKVTFHKTFVKYHQETPASFRNRIRTL